MSKIGRILVAVVQIGLIIALNIYAPGLGAALGSALNISAAAGTAIVTAVGTVAIALGGALVSSALFGTKTDMGKQKVNVRMEEAPRWITAGPVLQGGACVFAEIDSNGNLWYVIVHCDSTIVGDVSYYLDNVLVTINPTTHEVTTDDFRWDGRPWWYIWHYTYTETSVIPGPATELAAAFPTKWPTLSHKLVGCTYSVVKGNSIKLKNRYKVYKWRGPLGLGEPNLAIFTDWSSMYDPRDETQVLGDRTTYKKSSNSALVWAWWRTHPFGRNKPESDVNWDKIAEMADICDEVIVGIESTQPRYECAVAAQDNVDRVTIENQIMLSCDGQIMFDDQGKSWVQVGKYYAPTLMLNRNRDIITMSSIEAQDGESETQGVIVRYMDHNANFSIQPSAAWYNPNYYQSGKGNTFLVVEVATCYNHNQAMRIAKSIGMRSQPTHKITPIVGLRGLRAMQERIVNIEYDNEFAGDYEIVTPVDVDDTGMICTLGLTPMDANRFDLLPGEEKPRPNSSSSSSTGSVAMPVIDTIAFNNNRIEVVFEPPVRDDVDYEFQFILQSAFTDTSTDKWLDMSVDMDVYFAYTGTISTTDSYYLRWRTVTSGGSSTAWYDPPYSLGGVPDTLSPPTNLYTLNDIGQIDIQYRNPTDLRFSYCRLFRNTSADLGTAVLVGGDRPGALGEVMSTVDVISPGTYYYWVIAYDSSGLIESDPLGPSSGISA